MNISNAYICINIRREREGGGGESGGQTCRAMMSGVRSSSFLHDDGLAVVPGEGPGGAVPILLSGGILVTQHIV